MEPTEFGWASLEVALSAAPKRTFNYLGTRSLWVGALVALVGLPLVLGMWSLNVRASSLLVVAIAAGSVATYGVIEGINGWNHCAAGRATNRAAALAGVILCAASALFLAVLVALTFAIYVPAAV